MVDTILVADDEDDVRSLVKRIFENQSYNVIEASNGKIAEELIIKEIPDIALLDFVMPIKSGIDVCRTLKNHKNTNYIPIIIFSALGRPVDKKMSKEAGAELHITKPFTSDQLVSEIKSILSDSKKTRFSRAAGFEQSQISKKVFLYEYDSSSNYEKAVRDYILEAKMNDHNPVIITRDSSVVQDKIKDEQSISLIPFHLPLDISQIILQPNSQCLVLDNLTDLILSTNFQTAYNFTRDSITKLNLMGLSALFLLNPDSHESQEVNGIRNLFKYRLNAPIPDQRHSPNLHQNEKTLAQSVFFLSKDSFVRNEEFDIALELFNPGKSPISLITIERIVPLSFKINRVSNLNNYKNNVLDFQGERIQPSRSMEIIINVTASEKGEHRLNPKIVFIDSNGVTKEVEPKPITINVRDM